MTAGTLGGFLLGAAIIIGVYTFAGHRLLAIGLLAGIFAAAATVALIWR